MTDDDGRLSAEELAYGKAVVSAMWMPTPWREGDEDRIYDAQGNSVTTIWAEEHAAVEDAGTIVWLVNNAARLLAAADDAERYRIALERVIARTGGGWSDLAMDVRAICRGALIGKGASDAGE